MRLTLLFCFISFCGWNQISDARQLQLDSIVTNLDKTILRNLDSLHTTLHLAGKNDEERVFLFYGLIAVQYKYDQARKNDKQAKEYSPYYIAYKRKGVCRDFALLFDELCQRSEIPCVVATGSTKVTPFESVKNVFKRRIKKVNHAWNVVKYNGKWHPVDPTWSKIDSIQKLYECDENGRRKYAGNIKISNREYYNKAPKDFYRKRTSVHPAYYCMDTVYTYKTSKRNYNNRKVYAVDVDYNSILDSLSANEDYELRRDYQSALNAYTDFRFLSMSLSRDFKFTTLKYSKFDPLTSAACDAHLTEMERKLAIIEAEHGYSFEHQFNVHKEEVLKLKKKLQRREQARQELP
ncbi:MAG: transglutaminase domain-containing protein [Fluviicola sp.]